MVVTALVGAGIFVLPGLVAAILSPAAIVAYLISGLAVLLVQTCFVEIGTVVRRSGGAVAYVEEAFGPLAVPPSLVVEKILEVVESVTWQLRHTVGPDAEPFLQWRRSMTGEQWIDLNASDDETWYARIERDFGMDARPKGLKRNWIANA